MLNKKWTSLYNIQYNTYDEKIQKFTPNNEYLKETFAKIVRKSVLVILAYTKAQTVCFLFLESQRNT